MFEGFNRIYFESFIDELWKYVNFNFDFSVVFDYMFFVVYLISQYMVVIECIFIYI